MPSKPSYGSDLLDASAALSTIAGFLTGGTVFTDGVNDATLTLYDNKTAGSGRVVGKIIVTGSAKYGGRIWYGGRKYWNGLYAVLAGTGATFIADFYDGG